MWKILYLTCFVHLNFLSRLSWRPRTRLPCRFLSSVLLEVYTKKEWLNCMTIPNIAATSRKGKGMWTCFHFIFFLLFLNFTVQIPNNLPVYKLYKHYKINSFLYLTMKIYFFFGLLSTFLKEGLRNLAEMCPRMKLDCRK